MQYDQTNRGFGIITGHDLYGEKYTVQESSLATQAAIWLGIDEVDPKIMASDAKKYNIPNPGNDSWLTYPIPPEVLLSTRMHLSQEQVAELIPILQYFVDHGTLPSQPE